MMGSFRAGSLAVLVSCFFFSSVSEAGNCTPAWESSIPTPNAQVLDEVIFGGELHICGDFTNAGGTPVNRVARWDGSNWHPLGDGFNGLVFVMRVLDGEIYVGGDFTASGATPIYGIAKWNGASWEPLGSGFTSRVRDLTTLGGLIYAVGDFPVCEATVSSVLSLPVHEFITPEQSQRVVKLIRDFYEN